MAWGCPKWRRATPRVSERGAALQARLAVEAEFAPILEIENPRPPACGQVEQVVQRVLAVRPGRRDEFGGRGILVDRHVAAGRVAAEADGHLDARLLAIGLNPEFVAFEH